MKWLMIIEDTDSDYGEALKNVTAQPIVVELLKKLAPRFQLEFTTGFDTIGDVVNTFESTKGNYNHICLVYQGNPLLDGLANCAFQTYKYGPNQATHSTSPLLDYTIQSTEKEKVVAEAIFHLLRQMCGGFIYPEDEGIWLTLEDKLNEINSLRQLF
jgi:hypothetical protein